MGNIIVATKRQCWWKKSTKRRFFINRTIYSWELLLEHFPRYKGVLFFGSIVSYLALKIGREAEEHKF